MEVQFKQGTDADAAPDCRHVRPSRSIPALLDDVRRGLLASPRELPPKYFYDERGSRLFDQICDSDEYYPTRTEAALLQRHADAIIDAVGPRCILEFGSGTSRKTRHLFDACESLGVAPAYVPFEFCREVVVEAREALSASYAWLDVAPLVGDYMAGLDHLPVCGSPTLFMFIGGTIGNFEPPQARQFLRDVRARMRPEDRLLLGADRLKDPGVLHAAYNDSEGITADFNLNVLRVLNRDVGAEFDEGAFEHYACYNPELGRIEMYLIAMEDQRVFVSALDEEIEFLEGEQILTEISRKFTSRELEAMLADGGFEIDHHFQAPDRLFSLVLARPVGTSGDSA